MHRLVMLFLGLAIVTGSAAGQSRSKRAAASTDPGNMPLVAVRVSGSQRFREADVIAEAGLKVGEKASTEDLKNAAERLNGTGAFKSVAYQYAFSSQGMKADFNVIDAERFVPARFDNFVWLAPKQLAEKIHGEVPLFNGELPAHGDLADEVSGALRSVLAQAGAEGTVNYQMVEKNDRVVEALFTIEGVRIDVHSVHFPGATPDLTPLLEMAAKRVIGTYYSASRLDAVAKRDFLPILTERGWLRASIGGPMPHTAQTSPDLAEVDVDLPVETGLEYRLKDLVFTGFKFLPAEQARKLMQVTPGQIANQVQFNRGLDAIRNFYESRGYIKAKVTAAPEFDDPAATVILAVQADEGTQYRMGTFEIEGTEKSMVPKLLEGWKLRSGEPYDKTYMKRYLVSAASIYPRMDQMNVSVDESIDETTQTVDVLLRFTPK